MVRLVFGVQILVQRNKMAFQYPIIALFIKQLDDIIMYLQRLSNATAKQSYVLCQSVPMKIDI